MAGTDTVVGVLQFGVLHSISGAAGDRKYTRGDANECLGKNRRGYTDLAYFAEFLETEAPMCPQPESSGIVSAGSVQFLLSVFLLQLFVAL